MANNYNVEYIAGGNTLNPNYWCGCDISWTRLQVTNRGKNDVEVHIS